MRQYLQKLFDWIPAICVMAVIFYFSSRTGSQSNAQSDPIAEELLKIFGLHSQALLSIVRLVRKSGHFLEYLALGVCVGWAMRRTFQLRTPVWAAVTAAFCYLYALTDEFHQLFVPGRSGLFQDTLIDLLGILTGLLFITLVFFWKKKLKNRKVQLKNDLK